MLFVIAMAVFAAVVLLVHGSALAYRSLADKGSGTIGRNDPKGAARQWFLTPAEASASPSPAGITHEPAHSRISWPARLDFLAGWMQALERLRVRAGTRIPLWAFWCPAVLALTVAALLILLGNRAGPTTAGMVVAACAAPPVYLRWSANRRCAQFQRQLPDALELAARSLRAGHPFLVGMKMVAEEFPDPIAREFGKVVEEATFGVRVPDALKAMTERIHSADLKFFVTALILQRETGGNLAEIIDSISRLTRERAELQATVRALSAEGRLSAMVLFVLPFVLGGALLLLNPTYIRLLVEDQIGHTMIAIAGGLLLVGAMVTRRLLP